MQRLMCKSKVHRATVTQAELQYAGSLTLDKTLMEAADLLDYEQVSVVNVNNGQRFETYLIPGKRNSGVVCLNGPAARLGQEGDIIIIMSYALYDEKEIKDFKPKMVYVNDKNKIVNKKRK